MAMYKSMLKSLSVKIAGKKRKCYHDATHAITKGGIVIEVRDGPYNASCYCSECTLEMIALSRKRLDEIEAEMQVTA